MRGITCFELQFNMFENDLNRFKNTTYKMGIEII